MSTHRQESLVHSPESNGRRGPLQGTEKEWVKVRHGFDTEKGTCALVESFRAHYNLVRGR